MRIFVLICALPFLFDCSSGDLPEVTGAEISPSEKILKLKGNRLAEVNHLEIEGITSSFGFKSKADTELIAEVLESLQLVAKQAYNLIVSNAQGSAKIEIVINGSGMTSCPSGFSLVGTSGLGAFCISTSEETSTTFYSALDGCNSKSNSRLCSFSQYYVACVNATAASPQLTGMSDSSHEWVSEIEDQNNSFIVGANSNCKISQSWGNTQSAAYRCCID